MARRPGLSRMVQRLVTPTEELDRRSLAEFCDARGFTRTDELAPRRRVRVGGEIRSVRIVPRAGAPALEATVSDGRGAVVAVFLGRRRIRGIEPGRRLELTGTVRDDRGRLVLTNPAYELLA